MATFPFNNEFRIGGLDIGVVDTIVIHMLISDSFHTGTTFSLVCEVPCSPVEQHGVEDGDVWEKMCR